MVLVRASFRAVWVLPSHQAPHRVCVGVPHWHLCASVLHSSWPVRSLEWDQRWEAEREGVAMQAHSGLGSKEELGRREAQQLKRCPASAGWVAWLTEGASLYLARRLLWQQLTLVHSSPLPPQLSICCLAPTTITYTGCCSLGQAASTCPRLRAIEMSKKSRHRWGGGGRDLFLSSQKVLWGRKDAAKISPLLAEEPHEGK